MRSIEELTQECERLFSTRSGLASLWQELAMNFYYERADFTTSRTLGTEFAEGTMSSFPALTRRDLGNSFSTMLRPTAKPWFKIRCKDREREKPDAKRWLEMAEGRMRGIMYDRQAMFVRATKEADHDFATFGQCAISCQLRRQRDGLIYQTWHLRDLAWKENDENQLCMIVREVKPTPTVRALVNRYGLDALHPSVQADYKEGSEKGLSKEYKTFYVVMDAEEYGDFPDRGPKSEWVVLHIDVKNRHVMLTEQLKYQHLLIPRWQTVSGSPYAFSPASVVALPDARLIQAMTLVLLDAGEKATSPPLIATENVVRGDLQLFAGGVTWVDDAYDERFGPALRPLEMNHSGMPVGLQLLQETRQMVREAFYLDKISLPPMGVKEMTAYEVSQRVQEYIRQALPLFEPMEAEYNGSLCETTFSLLLDNGAFGPLDQMPVSLRGAAVEFQFESPLHEAHERVKPQRFLEVAQIMGTGAQLDPSVRANLDVHRALRDAIQGTGAPMVWLRDEADVRKIAEQQAQAQAMADQAALVESAGNARTANAEAAAAEVGNV